MSSSPSTERAVVVPLTGFGSADAAVAIVGAVFTVTVAVPFTPPLVAVTVKVPAVVPAVKRPSVPIVPPPLTLQEKVGCVIKLFVNWSSATAVNCRVPEAFTMMFAGVMLILVSV